MARGGSFFVCAVLPTIAAWQRLPHRCVCLLWGEAGQGVHRVRLRITFGASKQMTAIKHILARLGVKRFHRGVPIAGWCIRLLLFAHQRHLESECSNDQSQYPQVQAQSDGSSRLFKKVHAPGTSYSQKGASLGNTKPLTQPVSGVFVLAIHLDLSRGSRHCDVSAGMAALCHSAAVSHQSNRANPYCRCRLDA